MAMLELPVPAARTRSPLTGRRTLIHRALRAFALSALLGAAGCAGKQAGSATPPPELRLSAASDDPGLFLGPEADAPVIGFLGEDVPLELAGPSQGGRVPVRIRGGLWVRAFVPETRLVLRAQRHGRVRGTPVYLGADDPVQVLGAGEKAGRLRVRATPRVQGAAPSAFDGTFPAVGLAAKRAEQPEALPAGESYVLAPGTALALHEAPRGALSIELPAQNAALPLRVLSQRDGWSAVRVGDGPYLVGYTRAPLVAAPAPEASPPRPEMQTEIPRRLVHESGELKRVASGARISFGERVIARLHAPGLARVLSVYPSGEVDALVAVDDQVTVRGLLRASDLTPYQAAAPATP